MVSMVVAMNVKTMKIWEGHGDGLVVDVSGHSRFSSAIFHLVTAYVGGIDEFT